MLWVPSAWRMKRSSRRSGPRDPATRPHPAAQSSRGERPAHKGSDKWPALRSLGRWAISVHPALVGRKQNRSAPTPPPGPAQVRRAVRWAGPVDARQILEGRLRGQRGAPSPSVRIPSTPTARWTQGWRAAPQHLPVAGAVRAHRWGKGPFRKSHRQVSTADCGFERGTGAHW